MSRPCAALLALWLTATTVAAQPTAPTPPAKGAAPATVEPVEPSAGQDAAESPEVDETSGDAESDQSSAAPADGTENPEPAPAAASVSPAEAAPTASEPSEANAPQLALPQATDQDPAPVFIEPEAPRPPNVELALYAGPLWRTPEGAKLEYGTALAWGVRVGVYPAPWLAARAYSRNAEIPVKVKPGGYDSEDSQYPDTTFEQGNLDVFGLGFRLEPGPRLGRRFRVFGVLDAAWTRFVAPEPKTRGAHTIRSSERRGVGVDYKLGAGVSFDPILDRMSISADATYGFVTRQTGNAFDDVLQGIDESGSIVHMAALPKFERSIEALFSIGLVL